MTYNVYRHGGKPYKVQLLHQNIDINVAKALVNVFNKRYDGFEYWLEECNPIYQAMSKDGL